MRSLLAISFFCFLAMAFTEKPSSALPMIPGMNLSIWSKSGEWLPNADSTTGNANWSSADFLKNPEALAIGQIRFAPKTLTPEAFLKGEGNGVNCTGSIVQFGDNPKAKAIFLSAAHCYVSEYNQKIQRNRPIIDHAIPQGSAVITLNHFEGAKPDVASTYSGTKVIYALLGTRDVILVEMNKTYEELAALGVTPLRVASKLTKRYSDITSYGLLLPQYQKPVESSFDLLTRASYLVKSDCIHVGLHSETRMGLNYFLNPDPTGRASDDAFSLLTNCSFMPGMSGGPILDSTTNEVVAIRQGYSKIDLNEVEKHLPLPNLKTNFVPWNYDGSTEYLPHCFNTDGNFDLTLATCVLPTECPAEEKLFAESECQKKNCDKGDPMACLFAIPEFDKNDFAMLSGKLEGWTESNEQLLSNACYNGLGWACYYVYFLGSQKADKASFRGNTLIHEREALDWLDFGCGLGFADACVEITQYDTESKQRVGIGKKSDEDLLNVVGLLQFSCFHGNGSACYNLAYSVMKFMIPKIDEADQKQLNAKYALFFNAVTTGCFNGNFASCEWAASAWLSDPKDAAAQEKYKQVLTTACQFTGADPTLCSEIPKKE